MGSPEKKQQVRSLYTETLSTEKVAESTGVARSTVRLWCRDLIDEARETRPRMAPRNAQLSDEQVVEARNQARTDTKVDLKAYAEKYGTNTKIISSAIRGTYYTHLNGQCPPVAELKLAPWPTRSEERQEQARTLYPKLRSFRKVAEKIGASRDAVARWCEGMILPPRKPRPKPAPGARLSNRKLSDDQVIFLRTKARKDGSIDYKHYAQEYGVAVNTISLAVKGGFYHYLDEKCPPVPDIKRRPQPMRGIRGISDEVVAEAITLCRQDPEQWTFHKLPEWIKAQSGRDIRPDHLWRLLVRRDPSLGDLRQRMSKPQRPARPPRPKIARGSRPKPTQTTLERRQQRDQALAAFMREENAYERDVRKVLGYSGKAHSLFLERA